MRSLPSVWSLVRRRTPRQTSVGPGTDGTHIGRALPLTAVRSGLTSIHRRRHSLRRSRLLHRPYRHSHRIARLRSLTRLAARRNAGRSIHRRSGGCISSSCSSVDYGLRALSSGKLVDVSSQPPDPAAVSCTCGVTLSHPIPLTTSPRRRRRGG